MRVLCIAAVLGASFFTRAHADDFIVNKQNLKEARAAIDNAKIDLGKAIELMQSQVRDGQLLIVRLEMKKNAKPRYGAYFVTGNQFTELEIDTVHGDVLDRKERNGGDQVTDQTLTGIDKAFQAATVTIPEAVKASTTQIKGGIPFEAEFRLQAGKPVIEVEVLSGDKLMTVCVNATDVKDVRVEEKKPI